MPQARSRVETSTWMPSLTISLDLALMPVASVGEHNARVADLDTTELSLRGADHRLDMAEVRRVGGLARRR